MATTISIQVSPYIKKFTDQRFGHPIHLTGKKTIHLFIRGLLLKTEQLSLFNDHTEARILPFTVQIIPPKGYDPLPGQSARLRLVNQLLETIFMEEMDRDVSEQPVLHNRRKGEHNLKVQLARFCEKYGIIVEEDITEDALVKMYYRYRKWISTPDPQTSTTHPALPSFTGQMVNTIFG